MTAPIKPGTLCVIIRGRYMPELAGLFCTFLKYEEHPAGSFYDCVVSIPNAPRDPYYGHEYAAPSVDLLPISGWTKDDELALDVHNELSRQA